TCLGMMQPFPWPWVESQVDRTSELWQACANQAPAAARIYSPQEQNHREQSYDRALAEVEKELRTRAATAAEQSALQARTTASFGRFSAEALDLPPDAIQMLTEGFLPVGTGLA